MLHELLAILRLVFWVNGKTTMCGLLVVVALGGRFFKVFDRDEMMYLIGVAVSAGFFAAKDGVRSDTPVAREDTPPAPPEPPEPPSSDAR